MPVTIEALGIDRLSAREKLDLIEDVIPLFDLPLSLKMERPPKRVYLAPQETPTEFEHLAGRVNLRVPEVRGHTMIVFE